MIEKNSTSKSGVAKLTCIIAAVIVCAVVFAGCGRSGADPVLPWQQGVTVATTTAVTTTTVPLTAAETTATVTTTTAATTPATTAEAAASAMTTISEEITEAAGEQNDIGEPPAYEMPEQFNPKGKPSVNADGFLLFPYFSMEDRDGNAITLLDYEGKVVVLNFWASWCPPCKEEMPDFEAIHRELGADGDTVILTVNLTDGVRETREKAIRYVDDNGYTFPVLFDEPDETGFSYAGHVLGIQSIPLTMVLDAQGYLRDYQIGATNKARVLDMVSTAK